MKKLQVITTAVALRTKKRSTVVPSLVLGIVVLAGQVHAQTGSAFTEQEKATFLKVHNDARRQVGTKPLAWDNTLANEAQQFANHLANTGLFRHANTMPAWKRDMGENLAFVYLDAEGKFNGEENAAKGSCHGMV